MSDWRRFTFDKQYFYVHKGYFKGRHILYRSVAAFFKENPLKVAVIWYEAQKGDWMKSDDGFVMKCLRRGELKNGKYAPTVLIRGIMGTFPYYRKIDGTTRSRFKVGPMLTQRRLRFGAHGRGSLAANTTPRHGKRWNARKARFARMFLMGMDPTSAYMMCFGEIDRKRAYHRMLSIMANDKDRVMEEIKNVYKDHFKSLGWDEQTIAKRLIELAQSKSPHASLLAIDKITELRGENQPAVQIGPIHAAPISIAPPGKNHTMAPPFEIEEDAGVQQAVVVDDEEEVTQQSASHTSDQKDDTHVPSDQT